MKTLCVLFFNFLLSSTIYSLLDPAIFYNGATWHSTLRFIKYVKLILTCYGIICLVREGNMSVARPWTCLFWHPTNWIRQTQSMFSAQSGRSSFTPIYIYNQLGKFLYIVIWFDKRFLLNVDANFWLQFALFSSLASFPSLMGLSSTDKPTWILPHFQSIYYSTLTHSYSHQRNSTYK
jgi:hypothetical protein